MTAGFNAPFTGSFLAGTALTCGLAAGFFASFGDVTVFAFETALGAGLAAGFLVCFAFLGATLPLAGLDVGFLAAGFLAAGLAVFFAGFFAAGLVGRADLRADGADGRVPFRAFALTCFEGFLAGLLDLVDFLAMFSSRLSTVRAGCAEPSIIPART
ncbi:MAG: hypothetical protein IPI73_22655 [Betaproteobacteria bacterium]|nr:hypothetical protein [Betaproteobacteria bacterium]